MTPALTQVIPHSPEGQVPSASDAAAGDGGGDDPPPTAAVTCAKSGVFALMMRPECSRSRSSAQEMGIMRNSLQWIVWLSPRPAIMRVERGVTGARAGARPSRKSND